MSGWCRHRVCPPRNTCCGRSRRFCSLLGSHRLRRVDFPSWGRRARRDPRQRGRKEEKPPLTILHRATARARPRVANCERRSGFALRRQRRIGGTRTRSAAARASGGGTTSEASTVISNASAGACDASSGMSVISITLRRFCVPSMAAAAYPRLEAESVPSSLFPTAGGRPNRNARLSVFRFRRGQALRSERPSSSRRPDLKSGRDGLVMLVPHLLVLDRVRGLV